MQSRRGCMKVPGVIMRGGTSKAVFFHERDLPKDPVVRDAFILAAYGSPDPDRRQLDGLGGATSTTSKLAIIGDGRDHGVDVTYEFGQVSIDSALVDRRGNCGNISSAVGPFAVDEGLVEPKEGITEVRFLNLNTGKVIVAHVPTRDGAFDPDGDFFIPGVPVPGSQIQLDYVAPGGAVTGRLLPTGNVRDDLEVDGLGTISVSYVDAANPLVFVRWEDLGLTGDETPDSIDADTEILQRIEAVRAAASIQCGIASTLEEATRSMPSVPKLSLVGPPRNYTTASGERIASDAHDLRASMMSMGRMHRSHPLTGAIATAVACSIPGTVANEVATTQDGKTRIGHPAGVMDMSARPVERRGEWTVDAVAGFRTARRLMEGHVLVPDSRLSTPAADTHPTP
ncbi:2-methylaconitate cis-trans isomerase PrpF family protein [Intrasporangium calvum]|uniref:2-methylaconitate cis-trans isomerase PrpF family protein n=1 Tax=Intrasporangium calvum TaxID=53358 RepID=UPI001901684F|nr:PrpF domain-containing protein [Intrasporangium calvum]